jgi:hypothetical protein
LANFHAATERITASRDCMSSNTFRTSSSGALKVGAAWPASANAVQRSIASTASTELERSIALL